MLTKRKLVDRWRQTRPSISQYRVVRTTDRCFWATWNSDIDWFRGVEICEMFGLVRKHRWHSSGMELKCDHESWMVGQDQIKGFMPNFAVYWDRVEFAGYIWANRSTLISPFACLKSWHRQKTQSDIGMTFTIHKSRSVLICGRRNIDICTIKWVITGESSSFLCPFDKRNYFTEVYQLR